MTHPDALVKPFGQATRGRYAAERGAVQNALEDLVAAPCPPLEAPRAGRPQDRVVCHGGMGITQKALAADVPVCVMPFGRDQFDVARHVEVADAGTRLCASRLRPDCLRSAVQEAMGKKGGAERIASVFALAGGPRAATEALAKLLNYPADKPSRGQARRPSS